MAWTPEHSAKARVKFDSLGIALPEGWGDAQIEEFTHKYLARNGDGETAPEPVQLGGGPKQISLKEAFMQGWNYEGITDLLTKGLPDEDPREYGFWDKVAKGIGGFIDPIEIASLFVGGGIGGKLVSSAVKRGGVSMLKRKAMNAGLKISAKNIEKQAEKRVAEALLVKTAGRQAGAIGLPGMVRETAHQKAVGEGYDIGKIAAEGGKSALAGAVAAPITMIPGGSSVASKALIGAGKLAGEGAAFATVPAALEGRMPTGEEIGLSIAQLGALKAPGLAGKIGKRQIEGRTLKTWVERTAEDVRKREGPMKVLYEDKPRKKTWFNRVYESMFAEDDAIHRAVGLVETKLGRKLRPDESAAIASTLYRGRSAKVERVLDKELAPIVDGMSKVDLKALDQYMIAKFYASNAMKPDGTKGKISNAGLERAGINPGAVEAVLAEGTVKFDAKAKAITALLDRYLDKLRPEDAAAIRAAVPDYIPMLTDLGKPIEVLLRKKAGKTAADPYKEWVQESAQNVKSPLANVVRNIEAIERYVASEEIVTRLHGMAKKIGYEGIMRPVKRGHKPESRHAMRVGKKLYEVDPEIAEALQRIQDGGINPVVEAVFAKAARMLRLGATGTPEFALKNFLRDANASWIYSKYGMNPMDLLSGMADVLGNTERYKRYKESGAAHIAMTEMDMTGKFNQIQSLSQGRRAAMLKQIPRHPIEALKLLGSLTENAVRMAEQLAGERGLSKLSGVNKLAATERGKEQLASDVRDLTIDFARMGYLGRQINAIVPFFNAHLQGMDKLARSLNFKKDPALASRTAMKAMATITAPSIALLLANREDPRWAKIPAWQKNAFWIIMPTNGHGPIIKIPKPFELGMIFGSIPERFIEYVLNEGDPAEVDAIKEVFGSMVPGHDIAAIKPLVEIWANKNKFTGAPIVSRRLGKLKPELQIKPTTSRTAQMLADAMGWFPEGAVGDVVKSPVKVEHLIRGYTGGVGRYATGATDLAIGALAGAEPIPRPDEGWYDKYPIRAFTIQHPTAGSARVSRFYEMLDDVTEVRESAELLELPADVRRANARDYAAIKWGRKHMNKLWERVRRIERDPLMSPQRKRERLDELYERLDAIAAKALTRIDERN